MHFTSTMHFLSCLSSKHSLDFIIIYFISNEREKKISNSIKFSFCVAAAALKKGNFAGALERKNVLVKN